MTELWELVAREQIRHTIAAYTVAGDCGRFDEIAEQFVPDGVLDVHGSERAEGRAAIAAMLLRNATDGASSRGDRPFFIRHFVSNVLIGPVTPDQAQASAYFAVFTPDGPDHWGRYRDVFVPDGDRWLLTHRTARVDSAIPGGWYRRVWG